MEQCKTIKELEKDFKKTSGAWVGGFIPKAIFFGIHQQKEVINLLSQICKQLIKMNVQLTKLTMKHKKKPTEYQKRIGKFLKEGHSIQESHRLAKEKK